MQKQMTVIIGADHAGFAMKETLVSQLQKEGFLVVDVGARRLTPTDDYPGYALKVGRQVAAGKGMGILLCGSGAGVCFSANKIRGVRATLAPSVAALKSMRADDDVNVLCLSARFLSEKQALAQVRTFLKTPFTFEKRFVRRLEKVARLEK
jgi:ribose 5-phosphate isomerase B